MENSTINLRVPKELKEQFEEYARSRDLTVSQLFRHFMVYQVEQFNKNKEKK